MGYQSLSGQRLTLEEEIYVSHLMMGSDPIKTLLKMEKIKLIVLKAFL